jgi:porphobilinogen synthase
VAEHSLSVNDLIAPLFVREGATAPVPIATMPGQFQHSEDSLVVECQRLLDLGIKAVLLFGLPLEKDSTGSQASDPDGIVQRVLRRLRATFGDHLLLISDLCLDEYTDHGHCGLLTDNGAVDNDSTLVRYGEVAVAQARAGAHLVAPSGMMDGQVRAIRQALDADGFEMTPILAYSAKYASALYGPFRDAVDVEIVGGGNRRAYQQDPANFREAMAEIDLDLREGADLVMVKPALTYLDVIAAARARTTVPIVAYHVSGEYAMVKAAGELGYLDVAAVAMEQTLAIKRAGADLICTYFAAELAEALA